MSHQEEGVAFLTSAKAGLLAFEQGLGKTLVAIESFKKVLAAGAVEIMVVICPNSLKRNWGGEIQKFAPDLVFEIVSGSVKERRATLTESRASIFVINYETARNEIMGLRALLRRRPAALVLDESHYIKNHQSLNATAALHLGPLARYRWLLSGTPITNSPADIYPQICLVAGEQPFGSFSSFEARYGEAVNRPDLRAALAEKLRPYMLRKTKEECLDLPDKTFVDVIVELPKWQRKIYNAMRDDLSHEVEGMTVEQFRQFLPTALTRLLRLSQIASNPGLILDEQNQISGKLAELDRIVEELVVLNNRKVILWSYYVATIEQLTNRYSRYGTAAIYGGTPVDERTKIASRFQDDPDLRLLIANPAAAGTGFTLTAASYAVYESFTWRYDYYAQSLDRNHRIGQVNPVTYIRIIAEGTVEQAIIEALENKAKMAGAIVGDDASPIPIAQLTPSIFCEILKSGSLPKA